MFEIMFEGSKSTFNTKKTLLKKNIRLVKKIKNIFKWSKNLKIVKRHFWQKLKNEAFTQKLYFSNVISNIL
jgi:hypothetical protein